MKFPAVLLFSGLLVVPGLRSETVTITGFVTSAASRSDFEVNAISIRCGNQTDTTSYAGKRSLIHGCPQKTPYLGEQVRISGSFNKKNGDLAAEEIDFAEPAHGRVTGSAVIDALSVAKPTAPAGPLMVRADGYNILITSKALIVWDAPLHSLGDVKAGDWIEYDGERRADGTVVAEKVRLSPELIRQGEEKLRAKEDFDPSTVPPSAKQSAVSRAFVGINPKRFPPYNDPAMQARIDEIGEKLVPAFQRELPATDPAKIDFRFQLIDTKLFRDAMTLASGVILVPRQVVERMQNDSQLATVLADNIACALERQAYRSLPAARTLTAGQIGADAAGIFVPGAGLIAPALGIGGSKAIEARQEKQSGRVSLSLLHDAGYDIDQAPIAWWLLASKQPKPISEIPLPERAANLYRVLGEVWNNPDASQSH